jgi:Heterokaryon incompatibility protein (HET)
MTKIYQRAELVIIWLGKELITDSEGLRLAMSLRTFFAGVKEGTSIAQFALDHEASGIPAESSAGRSLVLLYTRSWFRRIWIVQEFVSGKHALCGVGSWNSIPRS